MAPFGTFISKAADYKKKNTFKVAEIGNQFAKKKVYNSHLY